MIPRQRLVTRDGDARAGSAGRRNTHRAIHEQRDSLAHHAEIPKVGVENEPVNTVKPFATHRVEVDLQGVLTTEVYGPRR